MKKQILGMLCANAFLFPMSYGSEVPQNPVEWIRKYSTIAAYKNAARRKNIAEINEYDQRYRLVGGVAGLGTIGLLLANGPRSGDLDPLELGAIAYGGTLLAGMYATHFLRDMVREMTYAPDWEVELNKLKIEDFSKVVQIGGVPPDQRATYQAAYNKKYGKDNPEIAGKPYLVLKGFDDTSSLDKCNHYELYFIPLRGEKGGFSDFLKQLVAFIKNSKWEEIIDFIIAHPTPGASHSVWNGKILPSIIVGFSPQAHKNQVARMTQILAEELKDWQGTGDHPRYSEEIPGTKGLMYAGYGGDCKETALGQEEYKNMRAKPSTWNWLKSFIYTVNEEDMAYKSEDQRISTVPKFGSTE
jgi:hypothetical protein